MSKSVRTKSLALVLAMLAAGAACVYVVASRVQAEPSTAPPTAVRLTTVAHEILDIEAKALPTSQAMRTVLDETISNAARRVRLDLPDLEKLGPRERAIRVLQIIAGSLRDSRFVYPARGSVPTLHDALASVNVDRAGLDRLLQVPANAPAVGVIQNNPHAAFHIADCDILALLYVGIGEALRLPISMVELPAPLAGPRHSYVRMTTTDGGHVDWEATSGTERDGPLQDADYFSGGSGARERAQAAGLFAVAMSREQTLGYAHILLGEIWYGLGSDDQASIAYRTALAKNPQSVTARNELAWLLATSSDPVARNPAQAVTLAEELVRLWPSPVHFDTRAAAYASAGRMDDAVNAQVTAISSASRTDPSRTEFQKRCAAYVRNEPYIQPRREERQKEASREELLDSSWGDGGLKRVQIPAPEMPTLPLMCVRPSTA